MSGGVPAADRRHRTAVVWFRRDLRVHDHAALTDAVRRAERVACLFVLDERLLTGPLSSPNRTWFLLRSLVDLDAALRTRGAALHVRSGNPAEAVRRFAAEVGADAVYASRDYGPYARRRDAAVAERLAAIGASLHLRRGLLSHEPEEIGPAGGGAFKVFAAFWRGAQDRPIRTPLPAPDAIPGDVSAEPGAIPDVGDLGEGGRSPGVIEPGEGAARARLERWIEGGLERYHEQRNRVDLDGTSRLSQDLHFGLLSGAEVAARTRGSGSGPTEFARQLAWRDFYHHVIWSRPELVPALHEDTPRDPVRYRDPATDAGAAADLAAWREGRTGYSLVDAGMRQLLSVGWMHNRARLVVASFLTRQLLVAPSHGERHFMRWLTDGDLADNSGGWRWTAGVGAESQPWYRIMNPQLQAERFDPNGDYARRWLGIGDRPEPIVDLVFARQRALAARELS